MGCHSPHDWSKHDIPTPPGMEGAGEIFPEEDLPGRIVAPNLTPDPQTGIGNWSDDTLARAIARGVFAAETLGSTKSWRDTFPL